MRGEGEAILATILPPSSGSKRVGWGTDCGKEDGHQDLWEGKRR
jgi:hypothetical protein